MSQSDKINNALRYEKRKAIEHGAKHLGGPGNADFVRGDTFGEIKCRQSPVSKPELQQLINNKNISIVDSKGGFTKPAIDYRDRYHPDVRLISRRKEI